MIQAQQLGQPARVDFVTLVALFHGGILPRIAHHQSGDVWLQQVVQPGGPGSFFKRDVQVSRSPSINCRIMLAFVSTTHSITIFPAPFITAIVMLSLCTSIPIYFLLSIEGVPFCRD